MEVNDRSALDPDELKPLCSLEDDTRRRLYEFVVAAGEPVNRDRASTAVGIDRSLAAYHLDRLVEEGLLAASYARPEGRGGPGAGRPAKHYERAKREFSVSVPPRDYRLAAEVFVRAATSDDSGAVQRKVDEAARTFGRELVGTDGDEAALMDVLRRHGFEPYDDDGVIRLANCPFHQLAREHTDLVCGMNLAMLSGLVEAASADVRPRLDPAPDRCCVALDPA